MARLRDGQSRSSSARDRKDKRKHRSAKDTSSSSSNKKSKKRDKKDKKRDKSRSGGTSSKGGVSAGSSNVRMMGAVDQNAFGKYGILKESDFYSKQREFEVR